MKANAVMTRQVVCVEPGDTLLDAYEIMTEWEIRHLPVLDGQKLVGILSDRDILVRSNIDEGGIAVPAATVSDAMTPNPISCRLSTSIASIGSAMLEHKIDSIPVVDDDHELIGLVTSSDLIHLLVESEQSAIQEPAPITFEVHRQVRPKLGAYA